MITEFNGVYLLVGDFDQQSSMKSRIVSILHEPSFNGSSAVGTEPEPMVPPLVGCGYPDLLWSVDVQVGLTNPAVGGTT